MILANIVVIKKSGKDGSVLPLASENCTFGRGENADVRIHLPTVLDVQCELSLQANGKWIISNKNEQFPTSLNEKPLEKDTCTTIKSGDFVCIAGRKLRIDLLESKDGTLDDTGNRSNSGILSLSNDTVPDPNEVHVPNSEITETMAQLLASVSSNNKTPKPNQRSPVVPIDSPAPPVVFITPPPQVISDPSPETAPDSIEKCDIPDTNHTPKTPITDLQISEESATKSSRSSRKPKAPSTETPVKSPETPLVLAPDSIEKSDIPETNQTPITDFHFEESAAKSWSSRKPKAPSTETPAKSPETPLVLVPDSIEKSGISETNQTPKTPITDFHFEESATKSSRSSRKPKTPPAATPVQSGSGLKSGRKNAGGLKKSAKKSGTPKPRSPRTPYTPSQPTFDIATPRSKGRSSRASSYGTPSGTPALSVFDFHEEDDTAVEEDPTLNLTSLVQNVMNEMKKKPPKRKITKRSLSPRKTPTRLGSVSPEKEEEAEETRSPIPPSSVFEQHRPDLQYKKSLTPRSMFGTSVGVKLKTPKSVLRAKKLLLESEKKSVNFSPRIDTLEIPRIGKISYKEWCEEEERLEAEQEAKRLAALERRKSKSSKKSKSPKRSVTPKSAEKSSKKSKTPPTEGSAKRRSVKRKSSTPSDVHAKSPRLSKTPEMPVLTPKSNPKSSKKSKTPEIPTLTPRRTPKSSKKSITPELFETPTYSPPNRRTPRNSMPSLWMAGNTPGNASITSELPDLSMNMVVPETPTPKRKSKTPSSAKSSRKSTDRLRKSKSASPKVTSHKVKSPKVSPKLSGVRNPVKKPKQQPSPRLVGVKNLVKTPKHQPSPRLAGVKNLVKTPKHQPSPRLAGVKNLVKTPKKGASPSLAGVKQLLATDQQSVSPRLAGIKELVKTPKLVSPRLSGIKELVKTPKDNSPELRGVRELEHVKSAQIESVDELVNPIELTETPSASTTTNDNRTQQVVDSPVTAPVRKSRPTKMENNRNEKKLVEVVVSPLIEIGKMAHASMTVGTGSEEIENLPGKTRKRTRALPKTTGVASNPTTANEESLNTLVVSPIPAKRTRTSRNKKSNESEKSKEKLPESPDILPMKRTRTAGKNKKNEVEKSTVELVVSPVNKPVKRTRAKAKVVSVPLDEENLTTKPKKQTRTSSRTAETTVIVMKEAKSTKESVEVSPVPKKTTRSTRQNKATKAAEDADKVVQSSPVKPIKKTRAKTSSKKEVAVSPVSKPPKRTPAAANEVSPKPSRKTKVTTSSISETTAISKAKKVVKKLTPVKESPPKRVTRARVAKK